MLEVCVSVSLQQPRPNNGKSSVIKYVRLENARSFPFFVLEPDGNPLWIHAIRIRYGISQELQKTNAICHMQQHVKYHTWNGPLLRDLLHRTHTEKIVSNKLKND